MDVPLDISLWLWHQPTEGFSHLSSEIFAFIILITSENEILGFQRTPTAESDGQNFIFRSLARFVVPSDGHESLSLLVLLCRRRHHGEENLGFARISLLDILLRASETSATLKGSKFLFDCDLMRVDGERELGSLVIALKWGEEETIALRVKNRMNIKLLFFSLVGILVWWVFHLLAIMLCAFMEAMVESQWMAMLFVEALFLVITRRYWRDYAMAV